MIKQVSILNESLIDEKIISSSKVSRFVKKITFGTINRIADIHFYTPVKFIDDPIESVTEAHNRSINQY